MSSTYFTWAFASDPGDTPAKVDALEDVGDQLAKVPLHRLLMSASRNNWLFTNLKTLADRFGLSRLHRLASASCVIVESEVPSVIREIESLLVLARETPQSVAALLDPQYEAAEIVAALEASMEAEVPHLGPADADEDGASAQVAALTLPAQTLPRLALAHGLTQPFPAGRLPSSRAHDVRHEPAHLRLPRKRPGAPAHLRGFFLRGATHNLTVRLDRLSGAVDPDTIHDGGHELFEDYRAMAIANGVDPDDPALEACRHP